MRFMMMMIPDVYRRPVPPDFVPPADAVEKMGKFNEELRKAGVLLALDGLHPPGTAVRGTWMRPANPRSPTDRLPKQRKRSADIGCSK